MLVMCVLLNQPPNRDEYVPLSGTVVSGQALENDGIPAEQITVYVAAGKHEGEFFKWDAVWDEDRTGGRNAPGAFHFYNPFLLEEGVSIIFLWDDPQQDDSSGTSYFSKSYETKPIERRGQKGKRYEAKIRLLLNSTTKGFRTPGQAIAQIMQTIKVQTEAIQNGAWPVPEGRVRMDVLCQRIQREVSLILALLADAEMYNQDAIRTSLQKAVVANRRLTKAHQDVMNRCLLENGAFWERGPDMELLQAVRQRARAE